MPVLAVVWIIVKLLEAIGLRKPEKVEPSGVPIGGRGARTFTRNTDIARWYIKHWDEQTVLTDGAGESWRVEDYDEAIDNTYRFIIRRVA